MVLCVDADSQGADGGSSGVYGDTVDPPDRRRMRGVRSTTDVLSSANRPVVQGHDGDQRRRSIPRRHPHRRHQLYADVDYYRSDEGRRRGLQSHRQDRGRRVQRYYQPQSWRFVRPTSHFMSGFHHSVAVLPLPFRRCVSRCRCVSFLLFTAVTERNFLT